MTDNQLDIFAEIAPAAVAKFYPGDQWRSQSWEPQHQETINDSTGFARATLMCAWTGKIWVGGFLMVAEESGKVVYVLEIRPGGRIMTPRCTLPLPNGIITCITKPGVMADAAQTLAHAMTGYHDLRLVPLMEALDEFRRREVIRL